jgi:hypothetical protein
MKRNDVKQKTTKRKIRRKARPRARRSALLFWLTAENRARLETARDATGRTFAALLNDLIATRLDVPRRTR